MLIFLVAIFFIKHLFYPVKRLPPSPLSLPIIGHLYLIKNSLHQTLTSLSTKYGPVLYLRFGCRNLLFVSSPSAVEECFTKNDIIFSNRPQSMAGDKLSFNYKIIIWASYGYLWRALRRLTVNILCQGLIVGGTETTSMTIQWAMRLLLAHPEAFHKLRTEIDSKVGKERLLNESDFTNYTCVINETLRLYPPVPLLFPHYSLEDCTVGGYDVPKHTILMVNAWAIHRDPDLWDEPEKFKPERFEVMKGEKEGFNYKFVPFGMGRRACPGVTIALQSVSLVLGSLIQWFDWESVEIEENLDACYDDRINLKKDKPLEAISIPRQNCIQFLSQL